MACVSVDVDRVRVSFTTREKILGIVGNLDVPVSSVVSASEVRSWREVRGWRVGLGLPGYWLLGTWRSKGHKQLVALRRDVPAVRLTLRGEKYDEVLVETPDPAAILSRLPR
jgi:hypothetical protein